MNCPEELKYTRSHEWVKFVDEATVLMGITDHAQEELGDLVFVNLPEEGDEFEVGDVIADVESVKAVADIICPVAGAVEAINEELLDAPEMINEDPYGAWFVKLRDIGETEEFMSTEEYAAFVESEKESID